MHVAERPVFFWIDQKLQPLCRKGRRIFLDNTVGICAPQKKNGKFEISHTNAQENTIVQKFHNPKLAI